MLWISNNMHLMNWEWVRIKLIWNKNEHKDKKYIKLSGKVLDILIGYTLIIYADELLSLKQRKKF